MGKTSHRFTPRKIKRDRKALTGPSNEESAAPAVGHNRLAGLADEIRSQHDAVREATETAARHAIQCGRLLAEAKDGLAHCDWLPWLRENCELSERTAQAYMRLAQKHGDMDDGKAQRVADLPVREALKAVADERAETGLPRKGADWDEVWAWAERQTTGPFNLFHLESVDDSLDSLLWHKLSDQTGVPATVSFLMFMHAGTIPVLRGVCPDDIIAAIRCLKDVAEGDCSGLDIDHAGLGYRSVAMMSVLCVVAARHIVLLFDEIKDRRVAYTATRPEDFAEQYERDAKQAHAALLADLDAQRANIEARHDRSVR